MPPRHPCPTPNSRDPAPVRFVRSRGFGAGVLRARGEHGAGVLRAPGEHGAGVLRARGEHSAGVLRARGSFPWRRSAAAAVATVVMGACNVTATIDIAARGSGAGDVRVTALLDPQAAAQLGDPATGVRLGDLRAAGWTTNVSDPRNDGAIEVSVSRSFKSVEQGTEVLAALVGPAGPVRDLRLTKSTGWGRSRVAVSGVVDLTNGLATLGDSVLTTALGGEALGAPIGELVERYEVSEKDAFTLTLRAEVAGDRDEVTVRAGENAEFAAQHGSWKFGRLLFGLGGLILLLAGVALALIVRNSRLRR